jgi:hypothetical protein
MCVSKPVGHKALVKVAFELPYNPRVFTSIQCKRSGSKSLVSVGCPAGCRGVPSLSHEIHGAVRWNLTSGFGVALSEMGKQRSAARSDGCSEGEE